MKRTLLALGGLGLIFVLATLAMNWRVTKAGEGRIYTTVEALPPRDTAVLMGTDLLRRDGTTNAHFINRVSAAAYVLASGKARTVLISGSSNNRGYNEVDGMAQALSALGVPESAISRDYKGTRSYETAKRVKRAYGLNQVLVITDGFHATRCLYLFRAEALDAIAFTGNPEPFDRYYLQHHLREYFARVLAVIDVSRSRR